MKKRIAFLLSVVMVVAMLVSSAFPAAAAETGIESRLANADTATVSFGIADGLAHFAVTYNGNDETFTQARVTVTVQKRFLLVFWNDVGSWTGTSTEVYGDFYTTIPVEKTGMYRAVYTLEFYGTSGVVDVIESNIECKYE